MKRYADEAIYRDMLAFQLEQLGAQPEIEVPVPFGRIDIRTLVNVIEVEFLRSWRHGVRQAMAYAWQCEDLAPAIAIVGRMTPDLAWFILRETVPYCDLLILQGTTWVQPLSEEDVACEFVPASVEDAYQWLVDANGTGIYQRPFTVPRRVEVEARATYMAQRPTLVVPVDDDPEHVA